MKFIPSIWDRAKQRRTVLRRVFPETEDVLLSYGHLRSLDPTKIRALLGLPKSVNIWVDSSGFQIGNRITRRASVFEVFDFQSLMAPEVALSLDIPGDLVQTYQNALLSLTYSKGFEHEPMKIYAVATCNGSVEGTAELVKKYEKTVFDGVAVGALIPYGVANLENLARLLWAVRRQTTKPLHALGVGGYDAFYLLGALGIGSFDSSKFLVGAKWRVYHLPRGGVIYLGDHYKRRSRQTRKGDLPCKCPICIEAKRIEYFQEPKADRVAMLALHNFYMMKNEVKLINLAKNEGWFHFLLEDRARKSPALKRGLMSIGLTQKNIRKNLRYFT